MDKGNYYCEYCGHMFSSVIALTSGTCPRHPNGANRGPHKLYQGLEKSRYTCKYCGHTFPSIMSMVGATCPRHPDGANKGYHSPAL
jgi:DNA-directed RNA polymerase subunit RPC12/RpoP